MLIFVENFAPVLNASKSLIVFFKLAFANEHIASALQTGGQILLSAITSTVI